MTRSPVEPELVEGLSFIFISGNKEGQGFDKLSLSGFLGRPSVTQAGGID